MTHRIAGAITGLAITSFVAFIVAALQADSEETDTTAFWIGAGISLGVAIIGSAVWLLIRRSEQRQAAAPPGSEMTQAGRDVIHAGGNVIQAGRDIHMPHFPLEAVQAQAAPQSLLSVADVKSERISGVIDTYLCVTVENRSGTEIIDCQARLEYLETLMDGVWSRHNELRSLHLAWSFRHGGGDKKDIPVGSDRTFDLVAVEHKSLILIAAQERLRQHISNGSWRFACTVEARGYRPVRIDGQFTYSSDPEVLGFDTLRWVTFEVSES